MQELKPQQKTDEMTILIKTREEAIQFANSYLSAMEARDLDNAKNASPIRLS